MLPRFVPLLLVLLLLLQVHSQHSQQEYSWKEKICFTGEAGPCPTYAINEKNVSLAATLRLAELCAKNKEFSECCTTQSCATYYYNTIHRRYRYGWRIIDPVQELQRRRKTTSTNSFLLQSEALIAQTVHHDPESYVLFIQVGANVGATENDPIFPLLATNTNTKGILLEPADIQFEALQFNYRPYLKRVELLNVALCPQKGQSGFIRGKPPTGGDLAMPEFYEKPSLLYDFLYRTHTSQMGKVDINKDGSEEQLLEDSDDFVGETERTTITCIDSLASLLTPHVQVQVANARQDSLPPLVLVIDAEGSDLLVLRHVLTRFVKAPLQLPRIILLEHMWMKEGGPKEAFDMLDKHGYVCLMESPLDTLCVRNAMKDDGPGCCSLNQACSEACRGGGGGGGGGDDDINTKARPLPRPPLAMELVVDGEPMFVHLKVNVHPKNTATEFCIRVGMNMGDCNEKLVPMLLQQYNETFFDTG